ncbi:oligosaccharide flippase family protein, partial [bacterium]|nr:oligosaccharide flippase family protein [bacterium]
MKLSNHLVVKNSISGIIRVVLTIPILLIVVPYIIDQIGVEKYGIWSLAIIMTTYINFADLGTSVAVIKYVAEYEPIGHTDRINHVLGTGLMISVFLGILAFLLIIPFERLILEKIFDLPQQLFDIAQFVFVFTLINAVLSLPFGLFLSLMDGLQRMDLSNTARLIGALLRALGTVIVLKMGFGLEGMAIAIIATTMISGIATIILARVAFRSLRPQIGLSDISTAKELLFYGSQIQLA